MPDVSISRDRIPFLLGSSGSLSVKASVPSNPAQPFAPTDSDLINVDFGVSGGSNFSFGAANSLALSVTADTAAKLTPVFKTSGAQNLALLAQHGLAGYFDNNPDDLILALSLGASADATLAGAFSYSALKAGMTLKAGGDVGYRYFKAYPSNKSALEILTDFFGGLRLPANVTSVPLAGEVISFEYGGYLNFGANLSIGYQIQGSPSFEIGQLSLSEHYQLSLIGKLALGASVAGNFAVEVRAAQGMPGWANVVVKKSRSKQFTIAADVNVNASGKLQGLPGSPDEFLGALLGTNAKNWLNMINQVKGQVQKFSDLSTLQSNLDTLAKNFINEWVGKAFTVLSETEFNTFLQKVERVVTSYQNLDNSAISLFDRYFAKLDVLTAKLDELSRLTSWDNFKGDIDDDLWTIVNHLTGGDPLGWMLGRIRIPGPDGKPVEVPSLDQLKTRVAETLNMIQSGAHKEIREVIALAKSKFPLDGLINDLSRFDTIQELRTVAETKLGGLAERLIGEAVKAIKDSEAAAVMSRLNATIANIDKFKQSIYAKFEEAVNQSFSFALHAEYSRASENDALIDVDINLATDEGKALMRRAGSGDFNGVLSGFRSDLVKINTATLMHKLTKRSAFSVNVVGWHFGFKYEGFDQVIINTNQQVVPEANGALSVFTTIDMQKERERKKNGDTRKRERVYTNFLLRFIGETNGVVESSGSSKFDKANQQYLIDAITGYAASYGLTFEDASTTSKELAYYLSFAKDFGLADKGASIDALKPLLPQMAADDFGSIKADYQVRYTKAGLDALFSAEVAEDRLRAIMRKIVFANYIGKGDFLAGIAWCYSTGGVYQDWKKDPMKYARAASAREISPIAAPPFAGTDAPQKVVLQPHQMRTLDALYSIETSMVKGVQKLQSLIAGAKNGDEKISPKDFEKALGKIGDALKSYDDFDEGDNTVFALFDQLVNLRTGASDARISSLKLVSEVGSGETAQSVTKMFISQPEEAALPANA